MELPSVPFRKKTQTFFKDRILHVLGGIENNVEQNGHAHLVNKNT